jgi:hypothetical protein
MRRTQTYSLRDTLQASSRVNRLNLMACLSQTRLFLSLSLSLSLAHSRGLHDRSAQLASTLAMVLLRRRAFVSRQKLHSLPRTQRKTDKFRFRHTQRLRNNISKRPLQMGPKHAPK